MREPYFQLVASLPALHHFRRTRLLPVSRRRLEERLALLRPEDLAELTRAEDLVSWHRQPIGRTSDQIIDMYDELMLTTRNRELRTTIEGRMNMRTVIVALRLKRLGRGAPSGRWGVGGYTRMIESRWADPEFGLGSLFPWIPRARSFLEQGDALGLESLVLDESWKTLSRVADRHPFGFEQVFAFVFKWDILHRWLSYDAEKARQQFEILIMEVTRDHQDLFA